jgi:phosphoribosyl 1,2-cyclic phosphate phosphodiesterase
VSLLDAGITELADHFSFEEMERVLLTHFHMDHVQGLFPLRWAECERKIPVYRHQRDAYRPAVAAVAQGIHLR